jgi:molybdopterin biosynthesis enzyme MoaB
VIPVFCSLRERGSDDRSRSEQNTTIASGVHTMAGSIRIGVVTVSDRASRGVYEDKGGPAIVACLKEMLSCPWEAVARVIRMSRSRSNPP